MAAIGPAPLSASTLVSSEPIAVRISSLNAGQILSIAKQIVETMILDSLIDPPSIGNREHFVKYMLPVVQETLTRAFAVPRQFLESGLQFTLVGENSLMVLSQAEFCQNHGHTSEWKKLASMLYVMSLEIRRVQPDANKLHFDLHRPSAHSIVTVEEK